LDHHFRAQVQEMTFFTLELDDLKSAQTTSDGRITQVFIIMMDDVPCSILQWSMVQNRAFCILK